jgi:hypothetical protein
MCQCNHFLEEIVKLQKLEKLNKNSKLLALSPFLDSDGILRVGGRLQHSNLEIGMKYPILIPKESHLTHLLIADAHDRTFHGGIQLMLNYLRTRYWIMYEVCCLH